MAKTNYLDDSQKIRTVKRSGNVDYGVKNRKRNERMYLTLLRGYGLANDRNSEAKCILRWRDNGSKIWQNERFISLGKIGETGNTQILHRLGMYNTREYEIVHTDNSPFMLIEMEEDFETMAR